MFRLFFIFLIGLTAASCAANAASQHSSESVKVMILGTFHFTGGGRDVVNPDVDDFLSSARQAQIDEVLDRLEAFSPDKIMLEMEPEHEAKFNANYEAYLAGEYELSVNERQQLGMKLAARLGHERLYGIDHSNFLDYRPALAAAEELGQERLLKEREEMIEDIIASVEAKKGLSLSEWLIQLNTPPFGTDHYGNLTIAQMGTVEAPGALQIIEWWERNLVMFARTAQRSEPGDKILIIVGAGHKYLLHQFFEEAHGFELVSPLPYLE